MRFSSKRNSIFYFEETVTPQKRKRCQLLERNTLFRD